jgi:hypothetical protein
MTTHARLSTTPQQVSPRALEQCRKGYHQMTATFRPSERLCTRCGFVTYCPGCLHEAQVPLPSFSQARALDCDRHPKGGVQV